MAAPRARKQQQGLLLNPADGTAYPLDDDDGLSGPRGDGSCALAQLLAGVCAAFLFSVVGVVLTGDAGRSTLWAIGLVIGAVVGTYVTRPGSSAEADEAANRSALGAIAAASVLSTAAYAALVPDLAADYLCASVVAAGSAFLCQNLGSEEGRARAQLQARSVLQGALLAASALGAGGGAGSSAGTHVATSTATTRTAAPATPSQDAV